MHACQWWDVQIHHVLNIPPAGYETQWLTVRVKNFSCEKLDMWLIILYRSICVHAQIGLCHKSLSKQIQATDVVTGRFWVALTLLYASAVRAAYRCPDSTSNRVKAVWAVEPRLSTTKAILRREASIPRKTCSSKTPLQLSTILAAVFSAHPLWDSTSWARAFTCSGVWACVAEWPSILGINRLFKRYERWF